MVEHETGREVGWVNRYLDRELVRRLADTTLRSCAFALLHFLRWWESLHHTGDVREADLTKSTLLDYLKFQCSHQPPFSGSTINDRVAVAERALRNEFPDAPEPTAVCRQKRVDEKNGLISPASPALPSMTSATA
jgi:hypothetical protein